MRRVLVAAALRRHSRTLAQARLKLRPRTPGEERPPVAAYPVAMCRLALTTALIAATVGAGANASTGRPLDASDEIVVFHAAHYSPRPGSIFFGAFLRFTQPDQIRVFSLTCIAHVGGRIVHPDPGSVAFVGGIKLRPVIRRAYTPPNAAGRRFLQRVTCGWRIPREAKRKLLSLLPRPNQVPCDTSCPPTGLDIQYGSPTARYPTSFRTFNQTTWRVAAPSP
jgi:hypothetical protein